MAEAVKIANLQIEISDNSKTVTQSLNAFVKQIQALRSATQDGAGLSSVAKGLEKINTAVGKGGLDGLTSLKESLSGAIAPAERLADALERISAATRSFRSSKGLQSAMKTTTKLQEQATMPTSMVDKGQGAIDPGSGMMSKTQESIDRATMSWTEFLARTAQAREALSQMEWHHGYEMIEQFRAWKTQLEQETPALTKLKVALRALGNDIKSVGNFGKNVFHNILPQGITRLTSQFMRLAKMKILRTIITNLLKGFSEGLQNAYQWAKLTGDQFATSMDTIATSMNYAKNTIGAAFATVLNAVAPVIDQLVDWLVTGINYINMFFSALGGSTTYVRAKKVATAYDGALGNVASGARGATGAVKELEEQLSVLDFDELNQLADQQNASYGGGGSPGGGSGSATPDYADMFERVDIDNNIKKMADFLRENFDTILDIVKAIGAGILAWKLANAFSNSIAELSAMQKLGFATLVIGVVLSYEGGYSLGYDGFSVKGLVESLVGVGLSAIGGWMAWGAAGLAIGITVSVVATVTGFIKGRIDKGQKIFEESEIYQTIQEELDNLAKHHTFWIDFKAKTKSATIESDQRVIDVKIAQNILDQVKEFNGLKIAPDVDTSKLDDLITMFNNLNLLDVKLKWENINGEITINVEEIQKALDAYDQYIRKIAAQDLLIDLYRDYYNGLTDLDNMKSERDSASDILNMLLDNYQYTEDWDKNGNGPGHWQPGQTPNWLTAMSDPEAYAQQLAINKQLEVVQGYDTEIEGAESALDERMDKINHLYFAMGLTADAFIGVGEAAENSTPAVEGISQAIADIKPTSLASGLALGASSVIATPQGKNNFNSPQENVTNTTSNVATFSSVGLSAAMSGAMAYTGVLKNVLTQEQVNIAYSDAVANGYYDIAQEIKSGSNAGLYWTSVLQGMNVETQKTPTIVNDAANRTLVQASAVTKAGEAAETSAGQTSMFNAALNYLGMGVDFNNIATGISNNLGGQNWKGIANTQVSTPIETQINTIGAGVSASTIYSKVGSLIGSQPFSKIGTGAKSDIEGQVNQTGKGVNGDSIYENVSDKSISQPWSYIGRFMAENIAQGFEESTYYMRYVMDSFYYAISEAIYDAPWYNLGNMVGEEIKYGLRDVIGSFDFSVQVKANGRSHTVSGYAQAYFASGGWPQSGSAFIAGENGAELVGTVGGKTGVANRDQIASAIAQALKPMLGSGGGRTETIEVNTYLDSALIARANAKGQVALKKQFNMRGQA